MTEHTADLRQPRPVTVAGKRLVRNADQVGIDTDELIAALVAVEAQAAAPSRLDVVRLRDAVESVACQSAQPQGHRPIIDWGDYERIADEYTRLTAPAPARPRYANPPQESSPLPTRRHYSGQHDDCIATIPHYHDRPYQMGDWS